MSSENGYEPDTTPPPPTGQTPTKQVHDPHLGDLTLVGESAIRFWADGAPDSTQPPPTSETENNSAEGCAAHQGDPLPACRYCTPSPAERSEAELIAIAEKSGFDPERDWIKAPG